MMPRSGWLLTSIALFASGHYNNGSGAGVWYRYGYDYWDGGYDYVSFRAAG